jgi:pimeloyl-ACP methyl ester carboxylesterase
VVDGAFDVGDGRKLYLQCWGEGSPTIVIDAGGGEIQEYREYTATFTSRLAQQRRVCAYDRAGHGRSDPAPNKARQLEDVTGDLNALLEAAGVEGPLVLVGNSFGGFIMSFYANRYAEDVAGVVLLDVPAPSATMTEEGEPELAWDNPGNVEHNDVVAGFENRLANERFPFDAPLLVITATDGQSNVDDQAFWLEWSPTSRQIELDGGHEIHVDQPDAVAAEILSMN